MLEEMVKELDMQIDEINLEVNQRGSRSNTKIEIPNVWL